MTLSQIGRSVSLPSGRLVPDSYLTDGERLLRVVSHLEWDGGSVFATLEDCLTLEVRPYSSGELRMMGLQVVRPSAP